ncbi:hypothetical protein CPB84DRAFT_1794563, partial [Gymnopilus junonius]
RWYIYTAKIPFVSWSFSLILVARQALHGVDEEVILERVHAVGPAVFSLAYSLPILSVHVLYFIEVAYSTNSSIEAVVQALLLLLPDILSILSKIREMSGCIAGLPVRGQLSLTASVD